MNQESIQIRSDFDALRNWALNHTPTSNLMCQISLWIYTVRRMPSHPVCPFVSLWGRQTAEEQIDILTPFRIVSLSLSLLGGIYLGRPQKFQIFLPPPPFPQIHATSLTKVAYYVCFWRYPPPLSADVINGSPRTTRARKVASHKFQTTTSFV